MRITKLDGFRGIFSLMIVFLHSSDDILPRYLTSFYLTRDSYIFVDFFFVLSGFVITLNYKNLNSKYELKEYLIKRFYRLYPLLIYSSTITLFLSFSLLKESNIIGFFNSISLLNSTPIPNILYSISVGSISILNLKNGMYLPSWSISSEMVTYLLYGIISVYFFKKRKLIFLLLIILSVIFCFLKGGYWSFTGGLGVFRGLVSFFIGSMVFFIGIKIPKLKFQNTLIEIISILGFLLLTKYHSTLFGVTKQLFGMISLPVYFGFLIFLFSKSNGVISFVLESKIFQFLGMISFSIYLNHSIFVNLFETFILKYLSNMTFYFMVFFIIGYSYFTYKFIEQKGGKVLRSFFNQTKLRPKNI